MDLEKMNKRESRAEQIDFGGNFSRLQTGVRLRRNAGLYTTGDGDIGKGTSNKI